MSIPRICAYILAIIFFLMSWLYAFAHNGPAAVGWAWASVTAILLGISSKERK